MQEGWDRFQENVDLVVIRTEDFLDVDIENIMRRDE